MHARMSVPGGRAEGGRALQIGARGTQMTQGLDFQCPEPGRSPKPQTLHPKP